MILIGAVFAALVAFAILFVLVFQNPLFIANYNLLSSSNGPQARVTPFLPASPPTQWSAAGFAYSCSDTGPGALQISNGGRTNITVASVSLTYGGLTQTATGPDCVLAPGTSVISIVALDAQAGAQNSPYSGYLETSDGSQIPFSGNWA